MTDSGSTKNQRRQVSFLLGIGIVFLPIVFVWFLLRKGHSTVSRVIGFVWLLAYIGLIASPPEQISSTGNSPQDAETSDSPSKVAKTAEQIAAEARETEAREVKRAPEKFLDLSASGQKGGFDTVFLLSGEIKNSSNFDIKDAHIGCDLFGPSGTKIGSVSETLFEIVPRQGSKKFSDLNMGFMGSDQVASYNCSITDAEALGTP